MRCKRVKGMWTQRRGQNRDNQQGWMDGRTDRRATNQVDVAEGPEPEVLRSSRGPVHLQSFHPLPKFAHSPRQAAQHPSVHGSARGRLPTTGKNGGF